MRVNQRRPASFAAIIYGFLTNCVTRNRIGAVDFRNVQARKALYQFRNTSARCLHFHRNRNRVSVIFNEVQQRQFVRARRVQRFPEFAFARSSITRGDINNFICRMFCQFTQRSFLGLRQCFRVRFVVKRRFRRTHCLHKLRSRTRRLAHNIELGMSPVRRHLPPARTGIVPRTHRLQQHIQWRHSQHQAQRAIAIIRINPVRAGPQKQAHGRGHCFMTSTLDFAVIQFSRKIHRAI